MLFQSNRIPEAAIFAQMPCEKQSANLALVFSIPTPQLIDLHGSNLFNTVSQRYSTKRSHPCISPTIVFIVALSLWQADGCAAVGETDVVVVGEGGEWAGRGGGHVGAALAVGGCSIGAVVGCAGING